MGKPVIPVTIVKGRADVPARLAALDRTQRSAVLSTEGGGQPYASLVAFALTPGVLGLIFATPRASAKYANIRSNPCVALLIDNRANRADDIRNAEAVTIIGHARPVRRGKRHGELAGLLKAKHPELTGFIDAESTVLVLVEIKKAVHVGGFQEVTVWEPGNDA